MTGKDSLGLPKTAWMINHRTMERNGKRNHIVLKLITSWSRLTRSHKEREKLLQSSHLKSAHFSPTALVMIAWNCYTSDRRIFRYATRKPCRNPTKSKLEIPSSPCGSVVASLEKSRKKKPTLISSPNHDCVVGACGNFSAISTAGHDRVTSHWRQNRWPL